MKKKLLFCLLSEFLLFFSVSQRLCVFVLSFSFSVCLFVCLFVHVCLSPSVSVFIRLFLSVCLWLSMSIFDCIFFFFLSHSRFHTTYPILIHRWSPSFPFYVFFFLFFIFDCLFYLFLFISLFFSFF